MNTPKTDAQITGLVRLYPQSLCQTEVVSAAFARQLEQEFNDAKGRLAELAESLERCAKAWNTNQDVPYWVWQSMRQLADKAAMKSEEGGAK